MIELKPHIDFTEFGQINIDGKVYDYDVVIRLDGTVEKRQKGLSKRVYGSSHTMSLDEAKYIYDEGAKKLLIGSGQYGVLELSTEAMKFFKDQNVDITICRTPECLQKWNECCDGTIGVFHVTC
jgi:hypothetical protein